MNEVIRKIIPTFAVTVVVSFIAAIVFDYPWLWAGIVLIISVRSLLVARFPESKMAINAGIVLSVAILLWGTVGKNYYAQWIAKEAAEVSPGNGRASKIITDAQDSLASIEADSTKTTTEKILSDRKAGRIDGMTAREMLNIEANGVAMRHTVSRQSKETLRNAFLGKTKALPELYASDYASVATDPLLDITFAPGETIKDFELTENWTPWIVTPASSECLFYVENTTEVFFKDGTIFTLVPGGNADFGIRRAIFRLRGKGYASVEVEWI